ncbi:MAG: type II toxin-antitoxin system VapC family toxin [Nocardioides sp.]
MIALDTNMLVYANRPEARQHDQAHRAVTALLNSRSRIALPWPCIHEALNVLTHPRIYDPPYLVDSVITDFETLTSHPRVTALGETRAHLAILRSLTGNPLVLGPKVHDARIAAICIGHEVDELWTADRDFSLFPALKTRNPLVG